MLREPRPARPNVPSKFENNAELLEKFRQTKTKIAIQKDGELTDISRKILANAYNVIIPPKDPKSRSLVGISEDGEVGYVYARNKGICGLVTSGAVDVAVVGTDRLIEDRAEDAVDIIASYRDNYAWQLVLATPADRDIQAPGQIRRIATQYPVITKRYFESMGVEDVDIVATVGGTELYPYLDYGGQIDAVIDMSVTGSSLYAHNLTPWTPSIGEIYPVLIQSRQGSRDLGLGA